MPVVLTMGHDEAVGVPRSSAQRTAVITAHSARLSSQRTARSPQADELVGDHMLVHPGPQYPLHLLLGLPLVWQERRQGRRGLTWAAIAIAIAIAILDTTTQQKQQQKTQPHADQHEAPSSVM